MAAHKYWRVVNVDLAGGSYFEVSELRLCHAGAAVDASATISSSVAPTSGSIGTLIDGNPSTRCYWPESETLNPAFWIKWEFATAQDVSGVQQAGFDTSTRFAKAMTLQWSDNNVSWTTEGRTTLETYPGNNTLGPVQSIAALPAGAHRFWRFHVTEVDGSTTHASVGEIELFAAGSADLTLGLGARVTQSGDGSVGGGSAAVDDSSGSETGSSQPLPWWLAVDLVGGAAAVDAFSIRAQRVVPNRTPKNFTLQFSDDGLSWTTKDTFTNQTGWAEFEKRTFTVTVGTLSGVTKDVNGSPASRKVRVYREDSGALVQSVDSSASGLFSVPTNYAGKHTILVYPLEAETGLNVLAFRGVLPK